MHLRILVAVNEVTTAAAFRKLMEHSGNTIFASRTGLSPVVRAIQTFKPDLLVIEVTSTERKGIQVAQEVMKAHDLPVVFLAGDRAYPTFQAAKETSPAAYLLPPFSREELGFQIELAHHNHRKSSAGMEALPGTPGCIYLPVDKGYQKVNCEDVVYLKADGSYVKVYLAGKESPFHISANLSHLAAYFTSSNFYRVSRSLLVNLDQLERLEQNHLFMSGGKIVIPVPASNRKELLAKLLVVKTK